VTGPLKRALDDSEFPAALAAVAAVSMENARQPTMAPIESQTGTIRRAARRGAAVA
jgi:hypothetical protein